MITNIEPLESKLSDLHVCWAARTVRTGNIHIRDMISPSSNNAISRVFQAATAFEPTNLSFRNCDYHKPNSLIHIILYEPSNLYSNAEGGWAAKIGSLLDEDWQVCYTDGTGRQGHSAFAVISENRRGNPNTKARNYLGEEATVADAERGALALALKTHRNSPMLCILSDSTSAISTAIQISLGSKLPRSGIEIELGDLLAERYTNEYDTSIS